MQVPRLLLLQMVNNAQGMLISVVIPTYHRNDSLALCLELLAPEHQTLEAYQYEVIVSDDGSRTTAESLIKSRFPWVHWVAGPRQGPAANRNAGAALAAGTWIAFTDDDCLPQANWLETISKHTSAKEVGALEGAISATGTVYPELMECPVNEDGGHFWTANVAVRRDVFLSLGGFDESYPIAAHEDQDLYIRLQQHTLVKFIREAIVFHPVRKVELKRYFCSLPTRANAYAIHYAKHHPLGRQRVLLFELMMFHLRTNVRHIRQGKFKAACISIPKALILITTTMYYYRQTKRKMYSI